MNEKLITIRDSMLDSTSVAYNHFSNVVIFADEKLILDLSEVRLRNMVILALLRVSHPQPVL